MQITLQKLNIPRHFSINKAAVSDKAKLEVHFPTTNTYHITG